MAKKATAKSTVVEPGASTTAIEMSVYNALSKRKLYLKKIEVFKAEIKNYVSFVQPIAQNVTGNVKDPMTGKTREELEASLKATYDKYNAVFRNYFALSAAISMSNALTKITIAGKEYTVNEAITKYSQLNYEVELLKSIKYNIATVKNKIATSNEVKLKDDAIDAAVDKSMKALSLGDTATTESNTVLYEKFRDQYISRNTLELLDPYHLDETIDDKIAAEERFIADFNDALNISNIQTIIKVDLVEGI